MDQQHVGWNAWWYNVPEKWRVEIWSAIHSFIAGFLLSATVELAPLLNGGNADFHMSGEVGYGILLACVRAGVKSLMVAVVAKIKTWIAK